MHQPTIQPSAKPWGCSGGRRPGSRKDARQPQQVALAAWRALRRPFRRVSCRSAVVDETSSEVLRSRLLVQGVHRTLKPRSSKCFRDVPAANNLLDNVTMGLWRCANNTTGGRLVCVRQCYLEQLFGDIGKLLPGRRLAFANAKVRKGRGVGPFLSASSRRKSAPWSCRDKTIAISRMRRGSQPLERTARAANGRTSAAHRGQGSMP